MIKTKHPGMFKTVKGDGVTLVAGTGKVIGATMDTTKKVVTTGVKDVAKVGVDVEHAAVAVGDGAIKGTKKLAVDTGRAVADIAGGAVKVVGGVSSTVVDAARHTVHGRPDAARKPGKAKA